MAALIKSIVEKWVALYVRLSRDDENEGDSNSIAHQIEILTRYAREHGITNYKIYKDDGYSGTNFNRPGFLEMLGDIEAGMVSMVIVKDMSRFGRNYLRWASTRKSASQNWVSALLLSTTAWTATIKWTMILPLSAIL